MASTQSLSRAHAPHPRRRLRPARLGRAHLHRDRHHRLHHRPERGHRPGGDRHLPGAQLPERHRRARARPSPSTATGYPCRTRPTPMLSANFECTIPRAVVNGGALSGSTVYPAHAMIYGHGLLGSADEITDSVIENMANEHDFVVCGTNWLGLSEDDVGHRRRHPAGHLQVPDAARPGSAGHARLPVPGSTDGPAGGFDTVARLPGRRGQAGDRAPRSVLLRQQPGRHPGRCPHRGRAGLHPVGAGRSRAWTTPCC